MSAFPPPLTVMTRPILGLGPLVDGTQGIQAADVTQARILIVDDSETSVRLLRRILYNGQFTEVDATTDSCAVFELQRHNPYDLILLDLEMPRMNGFEVMEGLKSLDIDGRLPVVVLASTPSDKLRALRAGARDYLSRPFDTGDVLARVTSLLEARIPERLRRHRDNGLARDLEVAAEIYRALIPSVLPNCRGYEIAASCRPADATSGDVYDVVERPNGNLAIMLADATGHGIGPALSATQLRSMVRMALRLGAPLDEIVAAADRQLVADLPPDRFVTAFLGEFDPREHALEYFSLGQGPLLHWHARSAWSEWRNASSPPFGVAVSPFERARPMHFAPGDVVVLATDGVFERTDGMGLLFGEAGVEAVLREVGGESAQTIRRALERRADAFASDARAEDDATIVVVKRCA